jgi:hypothetical protein
MLVYRDGNFSDEEDPDWWKEACAAADADSEKDFDELIRIALGGTQKNGHRFPAEQTSIGGEDNASRIVFGFEGKGVYVELDDWVTTILSCWIPQKTDWPGFLVNYVLPFARAASLESMRQDIEFLKNIILAYARHGEGTHIETFSGESRFDNPRRR